MLRLRTNPREPPRVSMLMYFGEARPLQSSTVKFSDVVRQALRLTL
jgi:hypothetical protein